MIAAVALVAALTAAGGCGGDDEPGDTGASGPAKTETERTETTQAQKTAKTQPAPPKTSTSPEQETGGAGDEEPARSLAGFIGQQGRISPRVVRVPPYIAIRVELRSADGRAYGLRFGRRTIRAGGKVASASSTFPGLRPGRSLVGRPLGRGRPVRVVANAEPGP